MSDHAKETILVTGATGNAGQAAASVLAARGFTVRAAARKPERLAKTPGVEAVAFDYRNPSTWDAALQGVSGVFLVAPPMDPEAPAKLTPFIDGAKAAGVGKAVFVSAYGVDQSEDNPLRLIERHLLASGMEVTLLRPNFFMENFSGGFAAPMIRSNNAIFLAAGEAKTSFVACADIADAAAAAFAGGHAGKAYTLTGPEALDHAEVAEIIGGARGLSVTYYPLPEKQMLDGARGMGMPEGSVQYLAFLYQMVRAGHMAEVTGDVEAVTGRKPTSFKAFAQANATAWTPEDDD